MRPPELDDTWVALGELDPSVMDRDELVEVTRQVAAVIAWCQALQVRATRRLRSLADEGRSEAPRDVLGRHGRQSSKDARTADERERVCSNLPGFEDALAAGDVAAGHVDAISSATRHLDDGARAEFAAHAAELLADAQRQGIDAFERNCRDLARHVTATRPDADPAAELDAQRQRANVKHWTDRETGMGHTHLELDPVRDRVLWTAVRASLARLRRRDGNRRTPWQQLEVDAVISAIGGGDRGSGRIPEITVLIDEQSRCHGMHASTVCETSDGAPLPVLTVQRLCCEAEVVIAHLDGNREVIDVGRAERSVTRAQRRALRAMHRACAHPDCTVAFDDCRIHHLTFWRFGGCTDIANLLPLCEQHHHLVHEGGWSVTMDTGRFATWTRPDGTHHRSGPTIDRRPIPRSLERRPKQAIDA